MNVRPDVLRQQGMPPLPPQMLSLNAPQFLQTQTQPGQQSPNHMNPTMGMLTAPNMLTPGRYPLPMHQAQQVNQANMQQAGQQRRHMHLQQSQGGHALAPPGGAAPGSHMGGLGHNQLNMGFPNAMMTQPGNNPPVRRVASQPQPLNQGSTHIGGMQQGVGGSMGMNAQTSMPAQLRQLHHQQQQQLNLRMQQQQQMQGQMSPEMAMNLRQGNPGLPQNVARTASGQAQLMGNLSQPPTLTQAHSSGMQSSHHRDGFQSSVPLPHQLQPTQLSSSPRPGSHSQAHTPGNMSMNTPGPAQGLPNRSQTTPDNNTMFLPFQNPPFQTPLNPSRLPGNNGQFPFVPSSTTPDQHSDMPQSMANGIGNTPGSSARGGFPTPAQQFEHMQEVVSYPFSMPPPQSNIPPPRPPSHNNHHPSGPLPLPQQHQQQPQHHSPHHPDPMSTSHPQRPHSQPQAQRPSSQGQSHTPRASQPQLPTNPTLLPPSRITPQHPGPPQSSQSTPGHQLAAGPRQQPSNSASASSSAASTSALTPSEGGPPHGQGIGIPRAPNTVLHVGVGQGLVRLLQFSGILANENKTKLKLSYWDTIVKEYFTPKAVMKFTLWKDNQRTEAKPFEIGVPILPRFFLVTTQSGVKSMTLSLDGARERLFSTGHAVVECVTAVWTYKYSNGYTVTLRGPLTAHVVLCASTSSGNNPPQSTPQQMPFVLKFENLQFDANLHDKYIALDSIIGTRGMESPKTPRMRTPIANGSVAQQREEDKKWEEPRVTIKPASIPGEPVNAFGIPQATMRCLELAESVGQMADLISFSDETHLGPLEALSKFASKIRESQPLNQSQSGLLNGTGSSFQPGNGGVIASPAVSLYSSLPQTATSSNAQAAQSGSPPQNAPSSADNSPQKQSKSILQSQGSGSSSAPSSTPATTSSSNTTPSMANASLKRKQTSDAASPTTANLEQAPSTKRVTRKRGRTAGG